MRSRHNAIMNVIAASGELIAMHGDRINTIEAKPNATGLSEPTNSASFAA